MGDYKALKTDTIGATAKFKGAVSVNNIRTYPKGKKAKK